MIYTIGYERTDLRNFIRTLQDSRIETLVDIRDRAQSRKKGFSKTGLAKALNEYGIDYIHLRALGDPKEGREAARSGRMDDFREIYRKVLRTPEAESAMEVIVALAEEKRVCLLCFERDHVHCHRSMVADELKSSNEIEATHLGVEIFDPKRSMRDCNQGSAASQ